MRHLVLAMAVLGIACATSAPVATRAMPSAAPEPVASAPTTRTAVEAAAEFALTTYVDESTR
ncbi:MAG TPA: hypothetical protein VGF41_07275, partial [Myxococcaceae bacterium]